MYPDDTPEVRSAVMKDPRQLKTGERLVYRQSDGAEQFYPTVTQVLISRDRVTVKLEHPSWPVYRFVECGPTVMVLPGTGDDQ